MSKTRFDYVELKATRTDEGFLIDSPIVARTGILTYTNADGSTRKELRLPEDVFHADSLISFAGKPITVDHPKGKVTSKDVAKFGVGTILSKGRQDEDNLRVDVVIHQPEKIGERRELSVGYDVDLEETPGEYKGERYDAIQRNIRANHLSIVKRGRAGAKARLNMDADEEIQIEKEIEMPKIRLDNGIEYEASPEVIVALEKARTDIAAINEVVKTHVASIATITGVRDTLQARVDSIPAEIEKARADAVTVLKDRAELETVAAKFKVDCKDKTDAEIKKAVIKTVNKDFDDTGKSAEYIAAAFDFAKNSQVRADAMQSQRQAVNNQPAKREDSDDVDHRAVYNKAVATKKFNKE